MRKKNSFVERWNRWNRIRKAQILLAGVAALLAVILIILLILGNSYDQTAPNAAASSQQPEETTASVAALTEETAPMSLAETAVSEAASVVEAVSTAEPVTNDEVTLTMTFAGDATFGRDSNADYDMSFDEAYDNYGPDYFFENVVDYFKSDDLTVVNFEGTLTTSTDRTERTFAFKGPASYTGILTDGSVEAVNIANNHAFDYGQQGYDDTKAALEDAGITSFGYDRSQVIDVKGIKVGLVGILELYEGSDIEDLMLRQIEDVKSRGAQIVIVNMHWGDEKSYTPTDIQTYLGHSAIDHGADLVIGHHPHVVQPTEVYKGKRIVYSLGNFCFGGNVHPYDMAATLYQQTFVFRNGQLDDSEDIFRFIPIRISSSADYNNYKVTVLDGEAATRVRAILQDRYTTYQNGGYEYDGSLDTMSGNENV